MSVLGNFPTYSKSVSSFFFFYPHWTFFNFLIGFFIILTISANFEAKCRQNGSRNRAMKLYFTTILLRWSEYCIKEGSRMQPKEKRMRKQKRKFWRVDQGAKTDVTCVCSRPTSFDLIRTPWRPPFPPPPLPQLVQSFGSAEDLHDGLQMEVKSRKLISDNSGDHFLLFHFLMGRLWADILTAEVWWKLVKSWRRFVYAIILWHSCMAGRYKQAGIVQEEVRT